MNALLCKHIKHLLTPKKTVLIQCGETQQVESICEQICAQSKIGRYAKNEIKRNPGNAKFYNYIENQFTVNNNKKIPSQLIYVRSSLNLAHSQKYPTQHQLQYFWEFSPISDAQWIFWLITSEITQGKKAFLFQIIEKYNCKFTKFLWSSMNAL